MTPDSDIRTDYLFTLGKRTYDLAARTHIMGILNVTPDSFSDGGRYLESSEAIERGLQMIEEGADFIDIGGESTRPGSEPISPEEELQRVLPVIEALASKNTAPISVDTYKAKVAAEALDAGAFIVNDITAFTFDHAMQHEVARRGGTAVLMHMKGTPKTMQENPQYADVVSEVSDFLEAQALKARSAGIRQVIVDPGIGFGKTFEHNLRLIRNLRSLAELGFPLLIGPSRKSFLGAILGLPVSERLEGTAAAVAISVLNGANIVRVHDVKQMRRVALVADALKHQTL